MASKRCWRLWRRFSIRPSLTRLFRHSKDRAHPRRSRTKSGASILCNKCARSPTTWRWVRYPGGITQAERMTGSLHGRTSPTRAMHSVNAIFASRDPYSLMVPEEVGKLLKPSLLDSVEKTSRNITGGSTSRPARSGGCSMSMARSFRPKTLKHGGPQQGGQGQEVLNGLPDHQPALQQQFSQGGEETGLRGQATQGGGLDRSSGTLDSSVPSITPSSSAR